MKKKLLILLTILNATLVINIYGQQTTIDSLKQVLLHTPQDTITIKTLLVLGDQYENNYPDTALSYYKKALTIAETNKAKRLIAKCSYYVGIEYYNISDYNNALQYYQKSLKIYEEINDKTGIAINMANISLLYCNQEDYDKALNYCQEALKVFKEIGNKANYALNLGNLGSIYFSKHNYDKALKYYFEALKINKEIANKYQIALMYGNIGIVYETQKDYFKALDYYKKALELFKETKNKRGIAANLNNLGNLYNNLKQYNKAIFYNKQSLKIAKEIKHLEGEKNIYNTLSTSYSGLKQYKKALEYKNLLIELNDSLFNKEKFKAIIELERKYNTEKDKLLIEKLQREYELQELNNLVTKRQRIIFPVILIFLIFIIIYIAISLKHNKKIKKELEAEYHKSVIHNVKIISKNKEIEYQKETISEVVKQFEDTINNLEDVYFRTDNKFIYQQVSPSIIKYLKLDSINQIIGKPLIKFWDITENDKTQIFRKIFKDKFINDLLFNYKTTDGEIRHAKLNARIIYKNKKFNGIEGIIRDVTKDIQLKEIEADYKKILNSITDVIVIIDKTGKILYTNSAAYLTSGYKPDEVIGKNIASFSPLSEIPKMLSKIKMVYKENRISLFETIIKDKNGIYMPVEISGELIKYKGETVGLGVFRDITERKVSEQALLEKTQKYEMLANTLDDFIWMVDLKIQNMYISPSCKKLTGYTEEEIDEIGIVNIHTLESQKMLNKAIAKALASSDKELRVLMELDYIHKNGDIIKAQVKGHIVYNENNKKIAFAAVSRFFKN